MPGRGRVPEYESDKKCRVGAGRHRIGYADRALQFLDSQIEAKGPEMALPAVSNSRRWGIVGLLFTASLINYLDRAAISFALPLISKDFHLTPETKGLLLSSFFWSYALMQVPIGWCADRLNLRWLYAGAFALWSLAQGLTGLAGSLAVLIGFRILLGIGESIYLPGGVKIISLLFSGKERGLPSGLFDFGTRTGLVLEGLLVPWLLTRYGWRHTFLLLGFTALIWIVPWVWVFPRHVRAAEAGCAFAHSPRETSHSLECSAQSQFAGHLHGIFLF